MGGRNGERTRPFSGKAAGHRKKGANPHFIRQSMELRDFRDLGRGGDTLPEILDRGDRHHSRPRDSF